MKSLPFIMSFVWLHLAWIPFSTVRAADPAETFPAAAKILSHRCLGCHNPTDHKGDFSLKTRQQLADSGMVDLEAPEESHLLAVLLKRNNVPPEMPKNADPLSHGEVNSIRKWLEAGMPWPEGVELEAPVVRNFDHWSLQPIQRIAPPTLESEEAKSWIRTPVDAFIWRKLRERNLHPSPAADRRTLIRRLTYDLIGLPPTPDEVEAFVNNNHPDAYRRLVDRLLASPRYGERWGRHWLDVAKYADTCGYDKDKLRPNAWPYRDYVIRSFNHDKPFARFAKEQIAGDVLYPKTADGVLGMGFIAAGPWDFIGHVEVAESKIDGKVARNLDRDEMVSNTMNAFCSVTIQCARCHNHKFDPFTQEHYYSLQSVFAALDRAERPYHDAPETIALRSKLAATRDHAAKQLRELDQELAAAGGETLKRLEADLARFKAEAEPVDKRPEYGYHSNNSPTADVEKWVEIDLGKVVEVRRVVLHPCHDEFAGIGAGFGFPVRYRIEGRIEGRIEVPKDVEPVDAKDAETILDCTDVDQPNPAIAPIAVDTSVRARFLRIIATKLALRSNDFNFALAEVEVFDADGDNAAAGANVTALDSIEAPVRWAKRNLTDNIWPRAKNLQASTTIKELSRQLAAKRAELATPDRKARRAQWTAARVEAERRLKQLPPAKMVYAGASHFEPQGNFKPTEGMPRPIHVLHRGEILQPMQPVSPGRIPLSLNDPWKFDLPSDHTEGDRRIKLAEWIASSDNPLTWRSLANRVWLYHFGRGLAPSPNDFGRMGAPPTHPELLDYLAHRLRDGGQSIKRLHRELVLSATYQQTSAHDRRSATIDASNRWLWRMNRRRLEAEEIRDTILSISGRMNTRMGGPGFYLFVLEKTAHSPHYEYHKFDPNDVASHRRSVYRFIARSQPDPFMTTLDCADSSQSTPVRNETLTSLQALSMLNNRFTLAMSEHFAHRLFEAHDNLTSQIEEAMQLAFGRAPSTEEQAAFKAYAEQHGLTNLCRVLLNLSELVYLD